MSNRVVIGRIRRWVLNFLHPITQWVGRQHMPFSKKFITGDDYFTIKEMLTPGTIFLSRTSGELSNVLNPGFWKHGAIYVGENKVVEALGQGVIEVNILDFIMKKDYIALLKPKFADSIQMQKAAALAKSFVGSPYDFTFEFEDKAFYCYEVIYRAYKKTLHEDGLEIPFKPRQDVFGYPVIVGDDFFNADKKWHCEWHNKTDNWKNIQ